MSLIRLISPIHSINQKGVKKRRLSHDNQSFINLKSNTMKNTDAKVRVFHKMARNTNDFI